MDLLELFVFDATRHSVKIYHEDMKPLFRAGDICKILGICNSSQALSTMPPSMKTIMTIQTEGGPQECCMLTEIGVYRLVMRSNKPIAEPFQAWVYSVIETIRNTGMYNLQQDMEARTRDMRLLQGQLSTVQNQVNYLQTFKDNVEQEHQALLLEIHGNKPLVYLGRVLSAEHEGKSLIKIGCTSDVRSRMTSLKAEYGTFTLLKVYLCGDHAAFEKFLHKHKDIRGLQYTEEILPGKKASEVFYMTTDQYEKTCRIAKCNNHNFAVRPEVQQLALLHQDIKTIGSQVTSVMQTLNSFGKDPTSHDTDSTPSTGVHESEPVASTTVSHQSSSSASSKAVSSNDVAAPGHSADVILMNPAIQHFSARTGKFLMEMQSILLNERANIFDVMCALEMVSGLGMIELMKGSVEAINECTMVFSGEVRQWKKDGPNKHRYTVHLLTVFRLFEKNMKRFQQSKQSVNMTNKQLNLRFSSSVNTAAKRLLKDQNATFHCFREIYRSAVRPFVNDEINYSKKRKLNIDD
jgi:prophage antirepressor-like protein